MPKPVLQALILADHVYQDASTGKKIIAGTYNRLIRTAPKKAPEPTEPPTGDSGRPPQDERKLELSDVMRTGTTYAFISLTDVRGPLPLELRYVDLKDNRALFRVEFTVACGDPLSTVEAIVPVPPLPVPHTGVYALELLSDQEPLGALRITAIENPRPE